MKTKMIMKYVAIAASLLLMVLYQSAAAGESGFCQGKTVDVFLNSSYLSGGDYFSPPDTYIKVICHIYILIEEASV